MNMIAIKLTAAQQVEIYNWVTQVRGKHYLWGQVISARDGLLTATFSDYTVTVWAQKPQTLQLNCFNHRGSFKRLKAYLEDHTEKQKLLDAA